MEDDLELKLIEQRKLQAMKRRLNAAAQPPKAEKVEKTDRQVVEGLLYDRADEVLEEAYSYYPQETERIVRELASMVRAGRFTEKVSGGELYAIFRQVGLRFNLKTSIKVQDRGKLVDLSEKLKTKRDE